LNKLIEQANRLDKR